MSRSPSIGIDFRAYQKVWRTAGVDHVHTNGLRNKFCETDASVIASIRSCQEEFLGTSLMPVISSGQWAGQAVDTYKAIGNTDLMYVCGGGIVAHPSGIRAGVSSIQQAWQAALQKKTLEDYASEHTELREALDFFGKPNQ
jgi:ribulose-bisphosphate carboxylase large chain